MSCSSRGCSSATALEHPARAVQGSQVRLRDRRRERIELDAAHASAGAGEGEQVRADPAPEVEHRRCPGATTRPARWAATGRGGLLEPRRREEQPLGVGARTWRAPASQGHLGHRRRDVRRVVRGAQPAPDGELGCAVGCRLDLGEQSLAGRAAQELEGRASTRACSQTLPRQAAIPTSSPVTGTRLDRVLTAV